MTGIFISYRRTDTAAIAGRVYDRLVAQYGAASVFLDVNDIPPGEDFRAYIGRTIAACKTALVFIGPGWIGLEHALAGRLHRPDDPVRVEIEAAIAASVKVIPVLVDGALMPDAGALPPSLHKFAFLNATRLDNSRDFHDQMVHLFRAIDGAAPPARPRRAPSRAAPGFDDRPATAVLPFTNFTGNAAQEHISDGIADAVINELSSWRIFPVIARASAFAFKGQQADTARIGAALGARYLVAGSFNRIGPRVRITAELIDVASGRQLVGERFDRGSEQLFDVHDEIAEMIAGAIAPEVLRAERQRVSRPTRRNPTSYEIFLRGQEAHYRYTRDDNAQAQTLFRKAIAIDAANAPAHALLASAMIHSVQLGWRNDSAHNYDAADALASRAVALDPRAPFAHFALGSAAMFLGRIDQGLAEMQEAIRINPSHAAAYVLMAHLHCFVGHPEKALASVERALRLSPCDPRLGLWLSAVSQANFFLGNYPEAASVGQRALSLIPANLLAQRFAAASLGQLGRVAEAAPIVAALRMSTAPSLALIRGSITALYRDQGMIGLLLGGLQKAGLD